MKQWWSTLEDRERLFVGGLGVFLAIVIAYAIIQPLFFGASDYRARVNEAQQDLAWMQSVAPQIKAGQNNAGGNARGGPMNVVIDRTLRRYGIKSDSTQQVGDGLRVKLDDVAFDSVIAWLGELHGSHGITIEAASVRQSGAPGSTDANFTLQRTQP